MGQYDRMAGRARTIYVREEDVALWERAEQYARAHRLTMSALILTALERYLADVEEDQDSSSS